MLQSYQYVISWVAVVAFPVYMLISGLSAYLGKNRKWAEKYGFETPRRFGYFYLGLFFLLLALAVPITNLIPDHATKRVVALVFLVPAAICGLTGLVGMLYLPSFLLPKWYREERGRRRREDQRWQRNKQRWQHNEQERQRNEQEQK